MAKLKDDPGVQALLAKEEKRRAAVLTADHVRNVKKVMATAIAEHNGNRGVFMLLKQVQRDVVAAIKT